MAMFIVLPSWQAIARVHSVHAMNTARRQVAADLWAKPTDLSHRPAYRQEADAYFTVPRRVEG